MFVFLRLCAESGPSAAAAFLGWLYSAALSADSPTPGDISKKPPLPGVRSQFDAAYLALAKDVTLVEGGGEEKKWRLIEWRRLWPYMYNDVRCVGRPDVDTSSVWDRKKCVRQWFQKRPGFCFVGYLCFSGSFTNELLPLTSFGNGISLTFHLPARALTVERTVIGPPISVLPDTRKLSSF